MDQGRFRVGLGMVGSYLKVTHDVDPGQEEPGLSPGEQPGTHGLELGMLEWAVDVQAGVHKRFAFELQLPVRATIIRASFKDRDGDDLPGFDSIHHRDETISGVGDVALGTRIGLVLPENVPGWVLALRLGASLPTGRIEPNPFQQKTDHQHMFFGSGTIDPIVGLDTSYMFQRWGLAGWTVARLPLVSNREGFQSGKVVVGGVGVHSSFGLQKWSFLLQPEVFFQTPGQWGDTAARSSGRTSLLATAGFFFVPRPAWQIHLLAKVPYFNQVTDGTLVWPFVAALGFSYTFDAKPHAH